MVEDLVSSSQQLQFLDGSNSHGFKEAPNFALIRSLQVGRMWIHWGARPTCLLAHTFFAGYVNWLLPSASLVLSTSSSCPSFWFKLKSFWERHFFTSWAQQILIKTCSQKLNEKRIYRWVHNLICEAASLNFWVSTLLIFLVDEEVGNEVSWLVNLKPCNPENFQLDFRLWV